jgi:hypothetical protein
MRTSRPISPIAAAGLTVAVTAALGLAVTTPAGARARMPVVQNLARISSQDVPTFPGSADSTPSEADTLVEPDIAVSPNDPDVAVSVAHDSRFPDGGAVGITHAWTRNGGLTWKHAPVAGLTTATGGPWQRVSDPVLAFGPDGDVYLSTIVLNAAITDCRSAVLVSRSTDGGATFAAPVTAQFTNDCNLFNDKNWITVDNGRNSPHRGRVYQVWTLFKAASVDQTVRWSDDHGRTWSKAVQMTPTSVNGTQNSQTLVLNNGTVVDTYLDFTFAAQAPQNEREEGAAVAARPTPTAAAGPGLRIMAIRSTDGGAHWSTPTVVVQHVGFGPADVRCCLHSGTADPVTGRLQVAYISENSRDVLTSWSQDAGRSWTPPIRASRGATSNSQRVNVDVAAYGGTVLLSYATRDLSVSKGRFWQQQISTSYDGGASYGAPLTLGPRYDSRFGAFAGAVFPGDYIGTAATKGRSYLAWAVASAPPNPNAAFHQVLYGAALTP